MSDEEYDIIDPEEEIQDMDGSERDSSSDEELDQESLILSNSSSNVSYSNEIFSLYSGLYPISNLSLRFNFLINFHKKRGIKFLIISLILISHAIIY